MGQQTGRAPAPNVLSLPLSLSLSLALYRGGKEDTLLIPLLPLLLARWPRHYVPLNCRHKQDGSLMSGECGGGQRETLRFEVNKVA